MVVVYAIAIIYWIYVSKYGTEHRRAMKLQKHVFGIMLLGLVESLILWIGFLLENDQDTNTSILVPFAAFVHILRNLYNQIFILFVSLGR